MQIQITHPKTENDEYVVSHKENHTLYLRKAPNFSTTVYTQNYTIIIRANSNNSTNTNNEQPLTPLPAPVYVPNPDDIAVVLLGPDMEDSKLTSMLSFVPCTPSKKLGELNVYVFRQMARMDPDDYKHIWHEGMSKNSIIFMMCSVTTSDENIRSAWEKVPFPVHYIKFIVDIRKFEIDVQEKEKVQNIISDAKQHILTHL